MSEVKRLIKMEFWRWGLLVLRKPALLINPLLFFLLVIGLFPLGVSSDPKLLHLIAPGIVWVAALLSLLMGLERLFQVDFESGVLEQVALEVSSKPVYHLTKMTAFWFFAVFPLLLLTPVLGVMFGLTPEETGVLAASILLGTPVVCVIAGILAALTVGLGAQSGLIPLLLLPLTIPVFIFGAGSVLMVAQGVSPLPLLSIMLAICMVSITIGPFVIAQALKLIEH